MIESTSGISANTIQGTGKIVNRNVLVDVILSFVYQEADSIDNMMERNSFADIYCIITG